MASSLESGGAGHAQEAKLSPTRHISPVVAHELNNILTIIQGYADRLLLLHGDKPTIEPQVKMISEAARRAATLVRTSVPPAPDLPRCPQPEPPSVAVA